MSGPHKQHPVLTQVIQQVNAHVGLVFSPDGNTLYAAGGSDDAVYVYRRAASFLGADRDRSASGHANKGIGVGVSPQRQRPRHIADGQTLVVANNYNDSISVIDTATRTVRYEHDLRPFFRQQRRRGTAASAARSRSRVVVKGNDTAYVSSDRDREVVVVDIARRPQGVSSSASSSTAMRSA